MNHSHRPEFERVGGSRDGKLAVATADCAQEVPFGLLVGSAWALVTTGTMTLALFILLTALR